MIKEQNSSWMIPNLFQLDQLNFIKKQIHQWRTFKDKQKYLPSLRNITYQSQSVLTKILVFEVGKHKKDNKTKQQLTILTQKQILSLDGLYQIMNQSMQHQEFSQEVSKIKQFQKDVQTHIRGLLQKEHVAFPKSNYLNFNVYKQQSQFYIKATFTHYDYQILISFSPVLTKKPQQYKIDNDQVTQQLNKKYKSLESMLGSLPLNPQITTYYKQFYDSTYFLYDQYMLKLQIYENYSLLRMKNYIPIYFQDYMTKLPLQGPIFSNAHPQCMYQHFTGFNADSTKFIEGTACQICQIQIDQLQQNQLLMMLRDNVANPCKQDILFCPEYNRFKIINRISIQNQEQPSQRTVLRYLNYYHFRINLKKISNKHRLIFYNKQPQEVFPLTFNILGRDILIIDPARGKYCQHYTFTDLRKYYISYDPLTNLYSCPIEGCGELMSDNDIIYLKEVSIIMDYVKFKCEHCLDYVNTAKVIIDHKLKKVYASYTIKAQDKTSEKRKDQITDFYQTLIDPFVPFAEYSLGIKDKQKQKKMNDYMFGGLRSQIQNNEEQIEQNDEEDEMDSS